MTLNQYFNTLDPAIYRLGKNTDGKYYIEYVASKFDLNNRTHGNLNARRNKIMRAFGLSETGIAALLYGLKGTGKSELTKYISNDLIKMGYPVILIDQKFSDSGFKTYIENLGNIGLLFDEFTSVYDQHAQEHLLSLFDGLSPGKRLIMLTTNENKDIVDQMKNRPGRVYYAMNFKGITVEDAMDVVSEAEIDNDIAKFILYIVGMRDDISWDILNVLIKEARLCRTVEEYSLELDDLNVDVDTLYEISYKAYGTVKLVTDDVVYKTSKGINGGVFFRYVINDENKQYKRYISTNEEHGKVMLGMNDEDVVEYTISKVSVLDLFKDGVSVVIHNNDRRNDNQLF